jgi:hypothetical protein
VKKIAIKGQGETDGLVDQSTAMTVKGSGENEQGA